MTYKYSSFTLISITRIFSIYPAYTFSEHIQVNETGGDSQNPDKMRIPALWIVQFEYKSGQSFCQWIFLDNLDMKFIGLIKSYRAKIMRKIGLIILGVLILGAILVLTLVMKIIEFFMGAILFVLAIVILIILYNKIKDKVS